MNADNQNEVVAIGELFKQATTGTKTWQLRKFVLEGVYMQYYNEKGDKRGEWDISNCTVKSMTSEEVGTVAAKHAFCLLTNGSSSVSTSSSSPNSRPTMKRRLSFKNSGPAQFVLCASSERNKQLWMSLLNEQIIEFHDPIRRFLRTGEIVHGNNIVKVKNVFGMSSNVRLVITNMPRILVINPIALVINDQVSWSREDPPVFVWVDDHKFKFAIAHSRKVMSFEDPTFGSRYWEDIFKRFPDMTYWVPTYRMSLVVDFRDDSRIDSPAAYDALERSSHTPRPHKSLPIEEENEVTRIEANIKFLQDAISNIDDLVNAIGSKINEIDNMELLDMSNMALIDDDAMMGDSEAAAAGDEDGAEGTLSAREKVTLERELRASRHRDRMQKKAQLQILKDNVTVLALNLKTMLNRGMNAADHSGDGSPVDSGMYSLAAIDTRAIQAVIAETAEMISMLREERLLATMDNREDVTVSAERATTATAAEQRGKASDTNEDVSKASSHSRNESMLSLPQLQSLPDTNIEEDIQNMDEYVQALQSHSNATQNNQILLNKLSSYENYSILSDTFILKVIDNFNSIDVDIKNNYLDISSSNFNPNDPKVRPSEWPKVRSKRVYMKEFIDRLEGSTEADIVRYHDNYLQDEEDEMVKEVVENGRLMNIEAALSGPQYASLFGGAKSARPPSESPSDAVTAILAAAMRVTDSNYSSANANQRPPGWHVVRYKRVLAKEEYLQYIKDMRRVQRQQQQQPLDESDDYSLLEMRDKLIEQEEELMMKEVHDYGQVLHFGGYDCKYTAEFVGMFIQPADIVFSLDILPLAPFDMSEESAAAVSKGSRPLGWSEIRLKRVYIKEMLARFQGVETEQVIIANRANRLQEEEKIMTEEVNSSGGYLKPYPSHTELLASLAVTATSMKSLQISEVNFNANNYYLRPSGWSSLQGKRVAVIELLLQLQGKVYHEVVHLLSPILHTMEENRMVDEAVEILRSRQRQNVTVDSAYFKTADTWTAPADWDTLLRSRLLRKKFICRGNTSRNLLISTDDLNAAFAPTDAELNLEQERMMNEVLMHGHPLLPETYLHTRIRKPIYFISSFSDTLLYTSIKSVAPSSATSIHDTSFQSLLMTNYAHVNTNIFQFALRKNAIVQGINYDPFVVTKRPMHWNEIRSFRMKRKEQLALLSGVTSEALEETKFSRRKQEEALMIREVELFNNLLLNIDSPVQMADLVFTKVTFSPNDPKKRPPGWLTIKLKRVGARIKSERDFGVLDEQLIKSRAQCMVEEEACMLEEVANLNNVVITGQGADFEFDVPRDGIFPATAAGEAAGTGIVSAGELWRDLLNKRVYGRDELDRLQGVATETIAAGRAQREKEELKAMLMEYATFGNVFVVDHPADFLIAAGSSTASSSSDSRPKGWNEAKVRRVYQKLVNNDSYRVNMAEITDADLLKNNVSSQKGKGGDTSADPATAAPETNAATSNLLYSQFNLINFESFNHEQEFARALIEEESLMNKEVESMGSVLLAESNGLDSSILNQLSDDSSKAATAGGGENGGQRILMQGCLRLDNSSISDSGTISLRDWNALQTTRVIAKDAIVLSTKSFSTKFPMREYKSYMEVCGNRKSAEETTMANEVATYGLALQVSGTNRNTNTTFSFHTNNDRINRIVRPSYWSRNLFARIQARVLTTDTMKQLKTIDVFKKRYPEGFPVDQTEVNRTNIEEAAMLSEVQAYGTSLVAPAATQAEVTEAGAAVVSSKLSAGSTNQYNKRTTVKKDTLHMRDSFRDAYSMVNREMVLNEENFDPNDPSKRPPGWSLLRMKRVIVKEQLDRDSGMDEDLIMALRADKERQEEIIMLNEIKKYGKLVGPHSQLTDNAAGNARASDRHSSMNSFTGTNTPQQALIINTTNYVSHDITKRPDGWFDLRLKRVMLKEHIDRIAGISESVIQDMHAERLVEEEMLMMDEVTVHKCVLVVGERKAAVDTSKFQLPSPPAAFKTQSYIDESQTKINSMSRPMGWKVLLKSRVLVKELLDKAQGVNESTIAEIRAKREKNEDLIMQSEAKASNYVSLLVYGTQLRTKPKSNANLSSTWQTLGPRDIDVSTGGGEDEDVVVNLLDLSPNVFDPDDPTKRPLGWSTIRKKRVMRKERLDRLRGVREEIIVAKREERIREEEALMLKEIREHGVLIGLGGVKPSQLHKAMKEKIEQKEKDLMDGFEMGNFDMSNPMHRPKGWNAVKLRRVYLKEWDDRKNGVANEVILERRYFREQEVEQEMIREMGVLSRIKKFEKLASKNATSSANTKKLWVPLPSQVIVTDGTARRAPPKLAVSSSGQPATGGTKGPVQYLPVPSPSDKGRPSVARSSSLRPSSGLNNFISNANQKLETLSARVANQLTDSILGENDPNGMRRSSYNLSVTGPVRPPRIIAPGAPRPIKSLNSFKADHLNTSFLVSNPLSSLSAGQGSPSFSHRGSVLRDAAEMSGQFTDRSSRSPVIARSSSIRVPQQPSNGVMNQTNPLMQNPSTSPSAELV